MSRPSAEEIRITYTTSNVDMSAFHYYYDEALNSIAEQYGAEHPIYINGEAITVDAPHIVDTSPIDTDIVLGNFQAASTDEVNQAVATAVARRDWPRPLAGARRDHA